MKDLLEVIAKIFLLIGGICYVIGLVVVNIHLRQYGYYSLNLLQPNYVTAGAWALVPMAFPLFIAIAVSYTLYLFIKGKKKGSTIDEKRSRTIWQLIQEYGVGIYISVVYMGLGFTILSLGFIGWAMGFKFDKSWILVSAGPWMLAAVLGFFSCLLVIMAILFPKTGKLAAPEGDINLKVYLQYSWFVIITVVFVVAYIGYFARAVYQYIPASLGGGRPHQVRLVVDPVNKPYFESSGLSFSNDPNKSESMDLIISADKEYILRVRATGRTIGVPREMVKAVLFERE